MAGVPEFSRGAAPDPLAYTPARAALLDRLDMVVSQAGFSWDRVRVNQVRLVTASATLQTVVNVFGRGFAVVGVCSNQATVDLQARIVLTVDGAVISDISGAQLAIRNHSGMYIYGAGNITTFDAVNSPPIGPYAPVFPAGGHHLANNPAASGGRVGFRSSLLVQVSTTSGTDIIGFAVVTTV